MSLCQNIVEEQKMDVYFQQSIVRSKQIQEVQKYFGIAEKSKSFETLQQALNPHIHQGHPSFLEHQKLNNESENLKKQNLAFRQRIQQLENLDTLYQKEASLMSAQNQHLNSQIIRLQQLVQNMKNTEREIGLRFDGHAHQLSTYKHQYDKDIQEWKEKYTQLQHKLIFEKQKRIHSNKQDKQQTEKTQLSEKTNTESQNQLTQNLQIASIQAQYVLLKQKYNQQKQRNKKEEKQWLQCTREWNETKAKYQSQIIQLVESNRTLNDCMTEIIHKFSQLQEKVKEREPLKTDKDLLQLQIIQLKKKVQSYEQQLTYAQMRIQQMQEQIEDLERQKQEFEEKTKQMQNLKSIDQSEELIEQIDVIGKQIGELKQTIVKLSPIQEQNHINPKLANLEINMIKSQLGSLLLNPPICRLLEILDEYSKSMSKLISEKSQVQILSQQSLINRDMAVLIEDMVKELNEQKRSRKILEDTIIDLREQLNSVKEGTSLSQVLPSHSSRISSPSYNNATKSLKMQDISSFKKSQNYQQISGTQSNKKILLGNMNAKAAVKSGRTDSRISLYLPQTRSLRDILQKFITKQTILHIMYKITLEMIQLIKNQQVNVTSETILVSGYNSLNPENIDIVVRNHSKTQNFYQCPQALMGQQFTQQSAVWNLGIIFDEMIHKKCYFNTIQQILDPQYRYTFKSFTFRDLKQLITSCLSKDPHFRPNLSQILICLHQVSLDSY